MLRATALSQSHTTLQEAAAEATAKDEAFGIGGDVGGKLNKTYEDLFPYEARCPFLLAPLSLHP